jgi:hypothetical protein
MIRYCSLSTHKNLRVDLFRQRDRKVTNSTEKQAHTVLLVESPSDCLGGEEPESPEITIIIGVKNMTDRKVINGESVIRKALVRQQT